MSFFLLGREESGDVRLLSPRLFETRQDATSELARLAADPVMADLEAEVYVVDLNSATPVLLVRQTAAATSAASETVSDEVEESAAVFEAPDEPLVEPVTDEAIAEAVVESEAVEDDLRAALLRTTAHMESTGIVAPESVGPEVSEEGEPAHEADDLLGEIIAETPEVTLEEAPGVVMAAEETPASEDQAEPEAPAWPWDTTAPASDEPPTEGSAPTAEAEPATEVTAAFTLDAIEDAASDDSSILLGLQADAALEPSRPVILGAYDDYSSNEAPTTVAPVDETAFDAETRAPVGAADVAEPMSMPDVESSSDDDAAISEALAAVAAEAAAVDADAQAPAVDAISDFIMDLESVTTVPETVPAEEPPAPEPQPQRDLSQMNPSEYVCEDCVYVETCPNKGQRAPKDCVSFQWK